MTSLTGSIVNGNNKIVPSFEYTTGGVLKAITFGNQAKTTFGLDNRGRTSKIHTVDETAQTIFNQVYAYDNVNNITSITDNIGGITQSYSYDQLNRLINAQSTNATNSQQNYQYQYGYDGANNRTVLRDILNGTTESYAYHGSNSQLLTKVTKNGQSEDFTYNTAGAITRRTKNGVITNYSYDGAGRLIEVKVGSTIIAKYVYDPYGRLVKTTEGSTTTVRLPRGNETAYEKVTEQGMPTVERKYIIALGRYIARDETIDGVTTRVFYHGDHLGSTRALSGEDSGSFTYDPFGNIVSATGDAEDHNHRFTGKPMDGTGLYYYGARFYDPTVGRFINMDPAKDGGNWWVYVNNNPLKFVDPDGRRAWLVHGTFSNNAKAWTPDFEHYIAGVFNESVGYIEWSGGLSISARSIGANDGANIIYNWHTSNPGEPIRLIGHSHGGNVAIMIANELAESGMYVDTLITVGTPVREYQLATAVGQHINVYSPHDGVQNIGGLPIIQGGLLNSAGRTFENTDNIKVSFPLWRRNPIARLHNHSDMHSNIDVWQDYVQPEIE